MLFLRGSLATLGCSSALLPTGRSVELRRPLAARGRGVRVTTDPLSVVLRMPQVLGLAACRLPGIPNRFRQPQLTHRAPKPRHVMVLASGTPSRKQSQQWTGQQGSDQRHDHEHRKDTRRKYLQVVADVERYQLHQAACIHERTEL